MKFDDIKKRILKNYKLLVSTKIIGGLASAITLLIIARFLGVEEFGIFAMVILKGKCQFRACSYYFSKRLFNFCVQWN